ncbi:MAG: PAS domain S-box protein [Sphingobacteriaceae bacterium]|nr:MAG: PAS domain S-box protein [Sphingobacteriaceae bacterium]
MNFYNTADLHQLIDSSPVGIALIDAETLIIEKINAAFTAIASKPYDAVFNRYFWDVFAEFPIAHHDLIANVIGKGVPHSVQEQEIKLTRNGSTETIFVAFTYTPLKDEQNKVCKVAVWATEKTVILPEQQPDKDFLPIKTASVQGNAELNGDLQQFVQNNSSAVNNRVFENENKLRSIINQAPVGICVIMAHNLTVVEVNDNYLQMIGRERDQLQNKTIWEAVPEAAESYASILQNVITAGEAYKGTEHKITLIKQGLPEQLYVNFVYEPLRLLDGTVNAVMVVCTDVSEQVLARKKVEFLYDELAAVNEELATTNEDLIQAQQFLLNLNIELEERVNLRTKELTKSELLLRNVFAQSPLAFCILEGPDQIISAVNEKMLALWGKTEEVIGKPHAEAITSAYIKEFNAVLEETYQTGTPYFGSTSRNISTDDKEKWIHLNFTYQPVKNDDGKVSSILVIVDDITQNAENQKVTRRISEQFETAVNAAHIGVWNIDPVTGILDYSPIIARIFGYEDETPMTFDDAIGRITDEYQPKLIADIDYAIAENNGNYDVVYAQRRFNDNRLIWIRSFGKVTADEQGKPVYFSGVVLDITQQIEANKLIENLNEELAAINEELAATNEELTTANEELADTNQELNDANHDLTTSNYALVQARNTLELANKKLTESEQNLQLSIESTDLALWTIYPDDQKLYLSERYRNMFGFPLKEEIAIEQVLSCVEPADVPVISNGITDAIATGKKINTRYRIRNRITGELRHLKAVGKVITNEWGKPLRIIGANIDITHEAETYEKEQRLNIELEYTIEQLASVNAEMAATNEELMAINNELLITQQLLQESLNEVEVSKERFKSMIHSLPIGVSLFRGTDMVFEEVNEALLNTIGKNDTITGKPLLEVFPELKNKPLLKLMIDTYFTGKENQLFEVPVSFVRNGEMQQFYFNVHCTAYIENGRITGLLQTGIDVTEQVSARRKIENTEESLRLAINGAQLGTYTIDLQTFETTITSRAKELFGFNADDETDFEQSVAQIREDYRDTIVQAFRHAIATEELFEQDYPVIGYHDRKLRWVRGVGKIQQNNNGQNVYSGILIDITEQKIDDQRKSDFISMVSHELKTPLTSLKAYVQILQKKAQQNQDGFALTTLNRAGSSINKMGSMINGFLNVSRLESGKIQLEMALFDMMALLTEVEQDTSITVTSHQFVFQPVKSNFVLADREKICQVISNLISNAVKYSPAHSTIHVACITKGNNVEVSVQDNGMGINRQDLDKVFDRYYRAQNFQMNNISGFGIGLYLCAQIIERHKGQIGADSEPGKGSTFYFTLPLA